MITEREHKLLKGACAKLNTGPDYRNGDYVRNLLVTAMDFQLRVETVNKAIRYFVGTHGEQIQTHGDLKQFLGTFRNSKSGNLQAANELWSNQCWTRLAFLREIVKYFDTQGVSDMKGLQAWANRADFNNDVAGKVRSQHHSMGPAIYHWLLLRVGIPTVKPDVHVKRFVEFHIGREPKALETIDGLMRCAKELGREPHELDSAIWDYEKGYV